MTELLDPGAAFLAQDPTVLGESPSVPTAPIPRTHDHAALEIAAAVMTMGLIVRARLASQQPTVGATPTQARTAWHEHAPTWLQLVVPAIKQAYALGQVDGLTDEELTGLATDYAGGLGEYVNSTSADALGAAMDAQLGARWSPQVAWQRAAAAYGLDKQDMKAYLLAMPNGQGNGNELAARALVDKAFAMRADRIGQNESYSASQVGQVTAWIWLARHGRIPAGCEREWEKGANEEHCSICLELAGQRVPLEEPFVLSNDVKLWAPRAHPGCVVGSTRVTGPTARAASTREYVGELVTIKTAAGYELTATPNHPIATRGGWVSASDLALGDHVLSSSRSEWVATPVDPDVDDVPPMIQEVAESFPVAFDGVPTAAEDFHGDGLGSEVHVVRANGLLRDASQPSILEHLLHEEFGHGGSAATLFATQGHLLAHLARLRSATYGVMSGHGDTATLTRVGAIPADPRSLLSRATIDSGLLEPSSEDLPADSQAFCERLLSDSPEVFLDEIVEVGRRVESTHVFNLETEGGWYIANGIVTHNCYCRIRLRLPEGPVEEISKVLPKAAGVALVAADTGRVLMLQRALDPKDAAGGTWEFPGGTLELGESALSAAQREWSEEVRKRFPVAATPLGIWTHGVYAGLAYEVPDESVVLPHTRGRVFNPDDPDGDQVEAIAWWDPSHLNSPNVRKELRESLRDVRNAIRLPVSKAYDPHEQRRADGRWATTTTERPVATPTPATGPSSAFTRSEPSAFGVPAPSAFTGSAFSRPAFEAAPTEGNAFGVKAFGEQVARRKRLVVRRTHVPASARPAERPDADTPTYFIPADHYHDLSEGKEYGEHYDLGEHLNFSTAYSTPVASSLHTPWQMLSQETLETKAAPNASEQDIRDHWLGNGNDDGILAHAQEAWDHVMENANTPWDVMDRLNDSDYTSIFKLAGWTDHKEGMYGQAQMRSLLRDALLRRSSARDDSPDARRDDSLINAYGDWAVWHDPQRLIRGSLGRALADALDAAEADGIEVRESMKYGLPVEQVFGFERGLHPDTMVDGAEAYLKGEYVPTFHRYRSALAEKQMLPLRFGIRETHFEPFVENPQNG